MSARLDLNKKSYPIQILLWHKRGPSNVSWWILNLRQRCRKLFESKGTGNNVLSIISLLVWIGLIDDPLATPLIPYAVRVFGPFFFKSILAHCVGSGWSLKISTRFIRTAFLNGLMPERRGNQTWQRPSSRLLGDIIRPGGKFVETSINRRSFYEAGIISIKAQKIVWTCSNKRSFNPNWHELWKQGKCSSLEPLRGIFYKTQ